MFIGLAMTSFAACGSSQRPPSDGALPDAAPADGTNDTSGRHPFLPLRSCGGSLEVSGTSPAGDFVAGSIYVAMSVHCGGVRLMIYEMTGSALIELDNPIATDAGAGSLLGQRTVDAFFTGPPTFVTELTNAAINITAADDPFTGADAGAPWGTIQGTFALTSDGLSLTGSFESPYCVYDDQPLCSSG
jgi:hypothetical protein